MFNRGETRQMTVGALTLAAFVGVLALSYGGDPATRGSVDDYRIFATFNRIDGLFVGDSVHLSGIEIGTVAAVELTDSYRARVTLRIRRAIELPEDTSAAIHTDGLFGSKYVELLPGGSLDALEDGDSITFTQDAVIVTELLDLIISQGRARQDAASEGKDR